MVETYSELTEASPISMPTAVILRQPDTSTTKAMGIAPSVAAPARPYTITILRLPEVMSRVGLKHAAIYERIAQGSFPKQISLGNRAVGWLEYEIEAWIENRINLSRSISVPARPAPPRIASPKAVRQVEHSKIIS